MRLNTKYILLTLLVFSGLIAISQNDPDSTKFEKYPVHIGNIGFATDSVEIVVGEIPRGEISEISFEIFNFGEDPVTFTNGQSNKFVSLEFQPVVLMPGMQGSMGVEIDAHIELDLGEFDAEIAITSDDKQNPYKFLTLLMDIIEGEGDNNFRFDSVPHIVFDHYNHDYGHLKRGKVLYHTFVVTNEGGVPLYISEIQVPKGISIIDAPVTSILPGNQSIIRLKLNARGRVGIQHQSVLVRSNDPENPLVILGLHGSVKVYPSHKKTSEQCGEKRQPF